jgi:hypothetical protein
MTTDHFYFSEFRKIWLPYALYRIAGPNHTCLFVNRNYKPLGMITGDYIEYSDHPDKAIRFVRDPFQFKDCFYTGNDAPNPGYLYGGADDFDRNYFPRLQRLLSHAHECGEQLANSFRKWRRP